MENKTKPFVIAVAGPMKKLLKNTLAVIFAAFIVPVFGMNAFAWDIDPDNVSVKIENMPENTVFIDILFKEKKFDKYITEFNETNAEFYGIDVGSEIVQYDENGFTSFLFRNRYSEAKDCCGEETYTIIGFKNKTNYEIFNRYREFKIAFCDAEGNVLGVTNSVKAERGGQGTAYNITVNGEKLVCSTNDGQAGTLRTAIIIFLNVSALILTAIIFIIVKLIWRAVYRKEISRKFCVKEAEEHGTDE